MSDSLDGVARRTANVAAANERIKAARASREAAKVALDDAEAELHAKLRERNADYPGAFNVLDDTKQSRMVVAPQLRNAGHAVIFASDPDYQAVRDAESRYRNAQCEYETALRARLPHGWEGDLTGPDFITLADVATWLKDRLNCVRSLKGFPPTEQAATAWAGCDIRDFYRVLDRLEIYHRPERPDDPTDVHQAEATLSDLLAWVRRQLPDNPYSGLMLFTGQGITTLGHLRVALLSEEETLPLVASVFEQCSGDQVRVLGALKTHQEIAGDFRSLPLVQRAEMLCRQRYGEPLTKKSLDRIRLEYHEKTGNPFGAVNEEQLDRVLDIVETIPPGMYPLAFAGLPQQQPPADAAAVSEREPLLTPEVRAALAPLRAISELERERDRHQAEVFLLAKGWRPAEISTYLTLPSSVRKVLAAEQTNPSMVNPLPPTIEPPDQEETTATGTSEQGEGDAIPTLPARCFLSLKAMLLANAVSADKSMTAAQIARKAEGQQANPESFKRPLSTLKSHGYTDSKKGTDGGCWLTVKGIDLAKKL